MRFSYRSGRLSGLVVAWDRPPCGVDSCGRRRYARDWCEMHYRRWLRTGDPTAWDERPVTCTVDDCEGDVDARGLCHGHYQRWQRHGDVLADDPLTRRKQPEGCTVDTCDRETHAKGLCRTHRARESEYGDAFADVPIRALDHAGTCLVENCSGSPMARSLCDDHYLALLGGANPAGATLVGPPRGGGWLSHGYVGVPVPAPLRHRVGATQEAEHRLVMVVQLGRALEPDETVHHSNGDRLDNRPANLELWSTMHPKGQRIEDKVDFALEILQRYAPAALAPRTNGEGTAS